MSENSNKIRGYEILQFERVELTQVKDGEETFLDVGTLYVLYFQESVRFILSLNNWNYYLLKRLFVKSSSKTNYQTRTYMLTGPDGYYTLTLTNIPHREALQNFETILEHTTNFSYMEENEGPQKKKRESYERKHNFSTSEKLIRSFAKIADRISRPFANGSHDNINLTHVRSIEALKNSLQYLPTHEFSKDEIERAVYRSKVANLQEFRIVPETTLIVEKEFNFVYESPADKEEEEILNEIEMQKEIQTEAKRKQYEYQDKEYQSRQKERELYQKLNEKMKKREEKEVQFREFIVNKKFGEGEAITQKQQEILEAEKKGFIEREKELLEELEKEEREIFFREKLAEEEREAFYKRERALFNMNKYFEKEKLEFQISQQKMEELRVALEVELQEKERITQEKREELAKTEKQMRRKIKKRLGQLKKQEDLTEHERKELQHREEQYEKFKKLKERRMQSLEQQKRKMEKETEDELNRLKEMEKDLEQAKNHCVLKEKELNDQVEKEKEILKIQEQWVKLTNTELERTKIALKLATALTEAEKREFHEKEKRMNELLARKEAELKAMETLNEKERENLKRIARKLFEAEELDLSQRVELELERKEMLELAKQKEMKLEEKEKETEDLKRYLQREVEKAQKKVREKEEEVEAQKRRVEEYDKLVEQKETNFLLLEMSERYSKEASREELERIRKLELKILARNERLLQEEMNVQEQLHELEEKIPRESLIRLREERLRTPLETIDLREIEKQEDITTSG